MKKLLTILLFLPFGLLAQEELKSSLKIGLTVSPEINGLRVSSPLVGDIETEVKFGFSTFVSLFYAFNNHVGLRTGLGYGKRNDYHEHSGLIFQQDIDPVVGIISESRVESQVLINEFQLPIILQLSPGSSNLFFSVGFELAYQQGKNSEQTVYYGNGTIGPLGPPRDPIWNFSSTFGVGWQFPIADKWHLTLEPVVKYYFKEYVVVSSNMYSIGFRSTLDMGL